MLSMVSMVDFLFWKVLIMNEFYEGLILEFRNPSNGEVYDGVVWRIQKEDETNISLYLRFVDKVV